LYSFPEGNSLAATEVVSLFEVSGSATAKRSNGKRENTQLEFNPTVEFNPTTQDEVPNVTKKG